MDFMNFQISNNSNIGLHDFCRLRIIQLFGNHDFFKRRIIQIFGIHDFFRLRIMQIFGISLKFPDDKRWGQSRLEWPDGRAHYGDIRPQIVDSNL